MKTIQVSKHGAAALVDDEDYERLMQYKWHLAQGYATRNIYIGNGKQKSIRMHWDILALKPGYECDHKDRNRLNNQRDNLRLATRSQNMANRCKCAGNNSAYKGVDFHKGKWRAQITDSGKKKHLGYYNNEIEAAKSYNRAAISIFGDFAKTNDEVLGI